MKTKMNIFRENDVEKNIISGDALNRHNRCFLNSHSEFIQEEKGSSPNQKLSLFKKDSGMTLIELLVTLAVGSIIIAAIYSIYISQVQGQATQRAVLEMQQGLRSALTIMDREIRTAGADPMGTAGAEILIASNSEFHFTHDIRGDEPELPSDGDIDDPNENIRYGINTNDHLGREMGGAGGLQSLLDNVDALNFVYLDRAGNVIDTPVAPEDLNTIRQVQVTVVVRYGQSQGGLLRAVTDNNVYRNQQGEVILVRNQQGNLVQIPNDTIRRLMMTTTITCRNMAIGI